MTEYKITMPEGWKPRAHNNCDFCKKDLVCHRHFGICPLSHAVPVKEVEPLAVLADRKGWWLSRARHYPDRWVLNFDSLSMSPVPCGLDSPVIADTYAAAEDLARAYLEGLDDKGGR